MNPFTGEALAELKGPAGPHITQVGDTVMCWGYQLMDIPTGSEHVRSAEVRLPLEFLFPPAVMASYHSVDGGGTVWSTYLFNYNVLAPKQTQVAFNAICIPQSKNKQRVFCFYQITGKLKV